MRPLVLFAAFLAIPAFAQDIPPRGTDATFDIASWNIEHFGGSNGPSNDALQIQNAEEVMRDADIDLWALQEIKIDGSEFANFLGNLSDQGLEGFLGPDVFGDQKLAFVWDPAVVDVQSSYPRTVSQTYLTSGNFGGRQPMELKADIQIPGQEVFEIFVIAFHAKANVSSPSCSRQCSYERRVAGAGQLKNYIDLLVAQGIENVVLLGDFNDKLAVSIFQSEESPYSDFLEQRSSYQFATEPLEIAGLATFCGNSSLCSGNSTIDHLMFSQGLFDNYVENSGDRYAELLTTVSGYVTTTSDHLPVLARFESILVSAETVDAAEFALRAAPSPFGATTTLSLELPEAAALRIELYDVLGRQVRVIDQGERAAGPHRVRVDGADLAPGVYTVRLVAGDRQATTRIVRR